MTGPSTQTETGKLSNTNFPDEELFPYSGPESSNNRDNVLTVAGIVPLV